MTPSTPMPDTMNGREKRKLDDFSPFTFARTTDNQVSIAAADGNGYFGNITLSTRFTPRECSEIFDAIHAALTRSRQQ